VTVTVNWERGFINVDHVALLDVFFNLFVRGSQLVCDPLGQVVDCAVRDWLVELPVEEVSLFSVEKVSVESSESGLGQNIRLKTPDSRTIFVGCGDFVST